MFNDSPDIGDESMPEPKRVRGDFRLQKPEVRVGKNEGTTPGSRGKPFKTGKHLVSFTLR